MSEKDDNEKIAAYGAAMMAGLAERHGPAIDVVDGYLAALTIAAQFCAMLDEPARSKLCDIFEDGFREDVAHWASRPDNKTGVTKRH